VGWWFIIVTITRHARTKHFPRRGFLNLFFGFGVYIHYDFDRWIRFVEKIIPVVDMSCIALHCIYFEFYNLRKNWSAIIC